MDTVKNFSSFCAVMLAAAAYPGVAQTNLPTFNVSSYGASGSSNYGTCSGQAGSHVLTNCSTSGTNDFQVGQGIHLIGVGRAPLVSKLATKPTATLSGSATGSHQYCYVVAVVDPFGGISEPSQSVCTSNNLPDPLSYNTAFIYLDVPGVSSATANELSPSFLWYVSEDGGDYKLLDVASIGNSGTSAFTLDAGQRAGGAGDNRGGWPDNLPFNTNQWPIAVNANLTNPSVKNEEFFSIITGISGNQITIADPLAQSFTGSYFLHDDTQAIENAITAAGKSGGIVQLNAGYYRVLRPSFLGDTTSYPVYTTDISKEVPYAQFSYLQLPNGSPGNVTIQGVGNSTFIQAAPDTGGRSHFIDIGGFGRPSAMGLPAYPGSVFKMQPVDKGATTLTLVNPPSSPTLKAGDDIWLYSGSYSNGQSCTDSNGTPGGQCHFSELNTIASIQGTTLTLVYPTSKRYYQDQYGNSFGLVKMPVTPHNVSLKSFQMDSYNPILSAGMVYGLLADSLTLLKPASHGQFGGGFKRDVTIQNSTWYMGNGDVSNAETDEFDQFTHTTINNNSIYGYGASGGEGPSLLPRIYGTEGSSQFNITNNNFYNFGIVIDQTTDDTVTGNHFQNGLVAIGSSYAPVSNCYQAGADTGFLSFGSQASVDVEKNTFTTNGSFIAPFILKTGSFNQATVSGNQITYSSPRPGIGAIDVLVAGSGNVTQNVINLSTATNNSNGICLTPNQQPTESISLQGNTIQGVGGATAAVGAGVFIPNPGFNGPAPISLQGDVFKTSGGPNCRVDAPNTTPITCQ